MELGITPVYSDPASPQQNGRHERMHRDLKAEGHKAARTAAWWHSNENSITSERVQHHSASRSSWHEDASGSTYWSSREYPRRIRDWDYEKDITPKMVTVNGAIRWKDKGFAMIRQRWGGKYVGLIPLRWTLACVLPTCCIGYFCEQTMKVYELNDFDF